MSKRIVIVVDLDNDPFDTECDGNIADDIRTTLVNVAELADGLVENMLVRSMVQDVDSLTAPLEWA